MVEVNEGKIEEESIAMYFLQNRFEWDKYTVCLFIFTLEHIIFLFQTLLEALIPDVPKEIKEEDRQRALNRVKARQDMATYKQNRKLDSLDDTIKQLNDLSKTVNIYEDDKGDNHDTVDPTLSARGQKDEIKKRKKKEFDLRELQVIAVERQKQFNFYQKQWKNEQRRKEIARFNSIMASRLDDDKENDRSMDALEVQSDSSTDDLRKFMIEKNVLPARNAETVTGDIGKS